jgi:hypothetical protein
MKEYVIYRCEDYQGLLTYIEPRCDMISLARYYPDKVNDLVPIELQHPKVRQVLLQLRKDFLQRNTRSLELLNYDRAEMNAEQLFDALFDQKLEAINANSESDRLGANDKRKESDRPFSSALPEYLGKWYTWHTGISTGPLFEMCFFNTGEAVREMLASMRSLFDMECRMNGVAFEDLTFYRDGRPLLKICSHEDAAVLYADGEVPLDLRKFGLDVRAF